MPTIAGGTVGTGGTYPTWAAWFAAAPADLTVADQIWQGRQLNEEIVSASTILYLTGKTADATRYFDVTTETGASFNDHANKATNALRYNAVNGAGMRVTADGVAAIRNSIPFTRVSKLQMTSTSNTTSTWPTVFSEGSGRLNINQCITEGFAANSGLPGVVSINGSGSFLNNSVVVQKTATASANIATLTDGTEVHNSTLVSLGATLAVGAVTQFASTVMKNVYVGGATTPDSGGTSTKTNCATSATATGYTTVPMSTATFQNITAGTHDLRLAAGSALIDAGVTDATYGAAGILGTARPQGTAYDIGAYEMPAAATATIVTTPGNAVASGATASVQSAVVIATTVGNAVAAGAPATVTNSIPGVTVIATVGAATAAGASATVGTFIQTDPMPNNSGTVLANAAVVWTWTPAGRIGAMVGLTATEGTGTTDANGRLAPGIAIAAGRLDVADRVSNSSVSAKTDNVFYQAF
jgi:hypothetical protein